MLMSLDKHNSRSELMVEQLVGTHVSFWEHLKKTTSPPFELLEASDNIVHLFEGQKNTCFIELREKGIIVHFKTGKNDDALIIPFKKLNIFKTAHHYAIYSEKEFCKLPITHSMDSFFEKVNRARNRTLGSLNFADDFIVPEA